MLEALAHLERAHHEAIVAIAVIAQRDAELEARIKPVAVHFAQVVVHAARAEHRSGDAGVDRELGGEDADALRAHHQDFVAGDELFEFVEETRIRLHDFARVRHPDVARIDAATAEAHVIAHHARAAERLEEIENFLAFAEGIHERRAPRAHVAKEKAEERGVILETR